MINKIIAKHLENSPRLIVPEVGAFVRRKESNEIVFVEVLKRDDGMLNGLIQNALNIPASDAAAMLDKYVANLRAELASNKKFIIDSVGVLFLNASGLLDFTCNPFAHSIPAPEQHVSILKSADEKPAASKSSTKPESSTATVIVGDTIDSSENEEYDEDEKHDSSGANFIEKIRNQHQQPESEEDRKKISIRTNRKRIKLDPITVLAIVAAVLAVISLVWGAIPSRGALEDETPAELVISAEEAK